VLRIGHTSGTALAHGVLLGARQVATGGTPRIAFATSSRPRQEVA
jgi:hypothetical protein